MKTLNNVIAALVLLSFGYLLGSSSAPVAGAQASTTQVVSALKSINSTLQRIERKLP